MLLKILLTRPKSQATDAIQQAEHGQIFFPFFTIQLLKAIRTRKDVVSKGIVLGKTITKSQINNSINKAIDNIRRNQSQSNRHQRSLIHYNIIFPQNPNKTTQ